jgi:nitrogen regulatory protein PII
MPQIRESRQVSLPGRAPAKRALVDIGIDGMTVSELPAMGDRKHTPKATRDTNRASICGQDRARNVTEDELVEPIVEAIIKNAASGRIGDRRIFIYKEVEQAIRIRNQERGAAAL